MSVVSLFDLYNLCVSVIRLQHRDIIILPSWRFMVYRLLLSVDHDGLIGRCSGCFASIVRWEKDMRKKFWNGNGNGNKMYFAKF